MWYSIHSNFRDINSVATREQVQWTEKARNRLRAKPLLERLVEYALADPKAEDESQRPEAIMTASQVSTALALIKKVLPDIAAQTIVVHDTRDKHPRDMSISELYDSCLNNIGHSESQTSQTLN